MTTASDTSGMVKKSIFLIFSLLFVTQWLVAQTDTLSKFDRFSEKGEKLFKIIPMPIYSYSTEAGNIYGLVKFNLFDLSKTDTISQPSKISGGFTLSSEGFVNVFVSTIFNWHQNKYTVNADAAYKKQPQFVFGIGNDVSFDDPKEIELTHFLFMGDYMIRAFDNFYVGASVNITDYSEIKFDTLDFPNYASIAGNEPNTNVGIGITAIYDSRDNRYNAFSGHYARVAVLDYPDAFGNVYEFSSFNVDLRTYFNYWKKHVIALQATTTITSGDVPFYSLAMMGGSDKMRGYYYGSLRDKVLFDTQVEYRLPIWKIFGLATWVGTGRVADSLSDLDLDGFWWSYGIGLRLRVDTDNNTNVRFDWGFGNNGTSGFYINFAEAF